jgi:hypothetical protein
MPGITGKDGARPALPKLVCFLLLCMFNFVIVMCVLLCVLCVNVYCTGATGCQPNCS